VTDGTVDVTEASPEISFEVSSELMVIEPRNIFLDGLLWSGRNNLL
jgi:hypothetical protein